MRPTEASQLSLSRLAGLRPVELFVLRTYSDRDAGTVHRTYYFSDRFVEYEYGGGGVQQFLPLVRSHRGPDLHLMSHVQDSGARLGRRLGVTLVNLPLESGVFLATDLRTTNLRRATLEMSQILLPETGGDADLSAPFVGTEHTVLFRGEVSHVPSITPETVQVEFESVEPRVPWRYALLPGTDPQDFGARFPLPYGQAKRVQLVGLDVGGYTTVAGVTTAEQTIVLVTDTERLSAAGIGYVGGERITWTGKTATSLTGVTRGSSNTVRREHTPGTTLLEVKDSTFVAAGFAVSAIGAVYVEQFNGELVRVVADVTRTVADTAVTGHAGVPLATVRLPAAQFESVIQQLETVVSVVQEPQVSGGTVGGVNVLTLDGDNITTGGSSQSAVPPNGVLGGWRIPNNFPHETIALPFAGSSLIFTFPAPSSGVALSNSVTVRAFNGGGSDAVFRITDGAGNALSPDFNLLASTTAAAPAEFTFTPSINANLTGAFSGKVVHVSGSTLLHFELERTATVLVTTEVSAESIEIGGTDETKTKISAAASRGTGYRLRLFADIDGPTAPSGDYTVPSGTLLQVMPDCIRHFAAVFCGLGHGRIDSASFSAVTANVDPNVHAFDARDFGETFYAMVSRAAWEGRLNITESERAADSQLFLHAPNQQYRFAGPVEVIDAFSTLEERGRKPSETVTRVRALYLRDQSRGARLDRDAYAGATSVDKTGTPTAKPTVAELDAAEDKWGRNDSRTLLFAAIRDAATLVDVVGWYAWEWIRDSREWTVRSVPWTVSYRLEPGDVVELRGIPWAPGEEWHARVLGVSWDPDTGQRDLSLLELSPSTAVAELLATATLTAAGVVQSTVLGAAALTARATVTANGSQVVVSGSAALVASAVLTAVGSGGVELGAAALVASAALTASTLDGDSGNILGQTQETVGGEPQSLAHKCAIDFDGSTESLTAAAALIGVANAWSIGIWLRPEVLAAADTVLEITSNAGTTNRISVSIRGATANDPIRVELNDSAGVLFKSYTWDSRVAADTWVHLVVTWNGTSLLLYVNGEAVTPTATPTNGAGTMTDTSRETVIGSTEPGAEFFDGQVHSVAVWDAVLSAEAVRQVFNQGDGGTMNLLLEDDDYPNHGDLIHWWRLAHQVNALGADTGTGTPITLA